MQFSVYMLLLIGFTMVTVSCNSIGAGSTETMSRPTRPKVFSSPEELRSYLDQLGNYYAIAGRPRFGKRNLAPWMANYAREDADTYRRLPITHGELLQLISSAYPGDD